MLHAIQTGLSEERLRRRASVEQTDDGFALYQAKILLHTFPQAALPAFGSMCTVGLYGHPHLAIANLDRIRRNVIGPQVKGTAAGEIKACVVPMTGENAIVRGATVQRKSHVRAAIIDSVKVLLMVE